MAEWPVALRGTTETVVTTRGPNDLWNVAALGVQAPAGAERASGESVLDRRESTERRTASVASRERNEPRAASETERAATATTWGNTRTRRNFHREGGGCVQFVSDPVVFVDAALSIREEPEPILDAADAWVEVDAEHVGTDDDDGTRREHWELYPVESEVVRTSPATINRGFNAVVEATVAASRLDVPAYDTETLRERLRFFADVARKCGGEREREAIQRVREHVDSEW